MRQHPLSLTPCFSRVWKCGGRENRFNGLPCAVETVETVPSRSLLASTPLKRGVNETQSSRPFGTYPSRASNPALKRRAIVICPSGTEATNTPRTILFVFSGAIFHSTPKVKSGVISFAHPNRRRAAPRPFHHPGGMVENNPAFQRRDRRQRAPSPEGTAESDCISRPFGTYPSRASNPALKRRAIVICPSGTEAGPHKPKTIFLIRKSG